MFDTADRSDLPQLLRLFRRTDSLSDEPEAFSPDDLRLVARHPADGIVACVSATIDRADRLARVHGLAVDPTHRGRGLELRAVRELTDRVLATGLVDSLYATDVAAREAFLGNGFRPMGIFPNPRLGTSVLLVRHRDGVLDRRIPVARVPAGLTAELIEAPRFVAARFHDRVAERCHPLDAPNALLVDADFELYLHLDRRRGYCALIGATPSAQAVAPHLDGIIRQLNDLGVPYVETLLPLHAGVTLRSR